MHENVLIIFVREPVEGQVKTRLAAALGERAACEFYKAFLKDLAVKVRGFPEYQRVVYYVHSAGNEFLKGVFPDYPMNIQQGVHLGERMLLAFLEAFKEGAKKVVLIGSDCPDLPAESIEEAFVELDSKEAVFGPCSGGGYYLVGMKGFCPELFEQIEWGTGKVLEETLQRAEGSYIRVDLLKEWSDIDTIEDLKMLQVRLAGLKTDIAAHTRELLENLPL